MKYKCKICGWTKENEPMMHITTKMLKEISDHNKEHKSVSGTLGKRIERRQRKV